MAMSEEGRKNMFATGANEEIQNRRRELVDESDADKDGFLNAAEFEVYQAKAYEYIKEKLGEAPEFTPEQSAELYAAMNKLNPANEGICHDDMEKMKAIGAKIRQMEAQQQQ